MRKIYLITGMWAALLTAKAQQTATFEEIKLEPGSWYNGSDGSGGFMSGGIWFHNEYTHAYGSWSGFSVSNMKDVTTAGHENQYSAITATGSEGSENYAVAYFSRELKLELNEPVKVEGFFVTNSVYAYLAMRDGSDWTTKFGGTNGSDPDFFKLMVAGKDESGNMTDTLKFYLADFRSDNSEDDYIIDEWKWLDLRSLGVVKELHFDMKSSDNGDWGMNTPSYFCIDNFTISDIPSLAGYSPSNKTDLSVFPNPVGDIFRVEVPAGSQNLLVTDCMGKIIFNQFVESINTFHISALAGMPSGVYFLKVKTEKGMIAKKIMKY